MRMNGSVRTQSMRSRVPDDRRRSKLDERLVSNQCSSARPRRTRGLLVCDRSVHASAEFLHRRYRLPVRRMHRRRAGAESCNVRLGRVRKRCAAVSAVRCSSAAMRSSSGGWLMNSFCKPLGDAAVDAECRHLLRQPTRGMRALERFERADHRVACRRDARRPRPRGTHGAARTTRRSCWRESRARSARPSP